jgi:hypothetical protein
MRAKLVQHSASWLVGEYEAPLSLSKKRAMTVWRVQRNHATGMIAMKINGGAGVWDETGRILFYLEGGADLAWSKTSSDCFSLENRFGPCTRGKGVGHMLRRRELSTFLVSEELEICVPMGGVEYLVINHAGDKCVATWLDQTQWGYVVIDLSSMTQCPLDFYHPSASLASPDFSLDDDVVVSCSRFRSGWWTDVIDDYWDSASPGGLRKVGTVSVQDMASKAISHHEVMVELPVGWIPDRPDAGEWNMIWGPEFVSERTFKIWLPDDSSEILHLPLPGQIEITRPLGTKREWVD